MESTIFRAVATAAVSAFVLIGCGGGGGDGPDEPQPPRYPLTISVAQNPITASVAQMDLPSQVTINATVQGTTTATTVYVVIADPTGTFTGTPSIVQQGATQYQATLSLASSLAVGTRTGNLDISVCADPQCASTLGKTSAPFSITIAENPQLTTTWTPGNISLTTVAGDTPVNWPASFVLPSPHFLLYARLSDTAGLLSVAGQQTVTAFSGSTSVALTVSPTAAAGSYTGNFDLVFCRDSACTKMYRGVTLLPYTVTIVPPTNLRSLAPLAGGQDWTTSQGNPAHTGYVPVTLNPANFSPRWLWRVPDPTNLPDVLDPVTAGGKVFVATAPTPTAHLTPILHAIDEAAGTVTWQRPIPDTDDGPTSFGLGPLTPPTIAGNGVYMARTVNTYPPQEGSLFGFDLDDGTPLFTPSIFPEIPGLFQSHFFERPNTLYDSTPAYLTPRGNALVMEASGTSFVSLDQATGSSSAPWPACTAATGGGAFGGTVAVGAGNAVYLASETGLVRADTCESIPSKRPIGNGMGPAIVPGGDAVVAVGDGNLINFDTAGQQIKWSAESTTDDIFIGSPAVTVDTVYVLNSGRMQLEARRESDGQILWTWRPVWSDETAFMGNVIATQNLVFVSTRNRVYAIDIATRQSVWMYPYGGKLALSANGVLYVRRGGPFNGREAVAAINLQ